MNGPGTPTRRGAAVRRLEGQHTGRSRSPAVRLDVIGPSKESIQGGGGEDGRGVLTSGRQCSRGRLGVVVHIGVVDVPGGGVPSTPVPWSRTTPAPTAQRLLSWLSRLHPTSGPQSSQHGAAEARSTPPPSSTPLLPVRLWNRGLGKTPSGWWGARWGPALGCRHWSRRPEGKVATALRDWVRRRRWRRGQPAVAATAPFSSPAGAKEEIPLANRPWIG
jgi:hypothetical protein